MNYKDKKYDKLVRTVKLLKKIRKESKNYKKNQKEMGEIEKARKELDDTLSLERSFNKSLNNAKNLSKKINDSEDYNYSEMSFNNTNSVDNLSINDDNDFMENGAYSSNYDFYNKRYKMLKLPKKLEYDKVIKFDIFPEHEQVKKVIDKILFYVLIAILVLASIFGVSKLIKYIRKLRLNIKNEN